MVLTQVEINRGVIAVAEGRLRVNLTNVTAQRGEVMNDNERA